MACAAPIANPQDPNRDAPPRYSHCGNDHTPRGVLQLDCELALASSSRMEDRFADTRRGAHNEDKHSSASARAPAARPRSSPALARTLNPEGAEVQLQVVDGDDLDPAERAQLHAAIEVGLEDSEADRVISAEESLAELRALRCVR
jgi:hypothetical protein